MSKSPRGARELYDKLSGSYGRLYAAEQSLKHSRILGRLEGRKCGLLVDVGCGDGSLLAKISSNYEFGIGLDVSPGMVKLAKEKLGDNRRTALVVADAGHVPVREGIVDWIISVSFAVEGPGLDGLIREAVRTMKEEESLMVLTVFHPGTIEPPSKFKGFQVLGKETVVRARETLFVLTRV